LALTEPPRSQGRCWMPKHFDVLPKVLTDNRIRTFAEVGVYKGKFLKYMLRQIGGYLDQYWAIDQWQKLEYPKHGRMGKVPQESWDQMYRYACQMMTYFPNLHVIRQPSAAASTLFPDGYFDMVYIDASHHYEDVLADIVAWKPKVRSGGILGGHDYINKQAKLQAKRAVDEAFPEGVNTMEDTVWWVKL